MSDEQIVAMKILKHWVLNLRMGNNPIPDAWDEVRRTIASLSPEERETVRVLVADLLTELDHGTN